MIVNIFVELSEWKTINYRVRTRSNPSRKNSQSRQITITTKMRKLMKKCRKRTMMSRVVEITRPMRRTSLRREEGPMVRTNTVP
jgi:hypothetical protein